jgi:hypothetical protein
MALVDQLERVRVATGDQPHQILVGELGQAGRSFGARSLPGRRLQAIARSVVWPGHAGGTGAAPIAAFAHPTITVVLRRRWRLGSHTTAPLGSDQA